MFIVCLKTIFHFLGGISQASTVDIADLEGELFVDSNF
jgi:hypothetical protein